MAGTRGGMGGGSPFVPQNNNELSPSGAGRFEFAGDGEQLPWLEGDDEEFEEGVDTARIVGFALIGLVLLAAIVGGIWFASRDRPSADVVADGSVIKAPEEPYKTKPEDPGGKVHEGTGDSSFAVAEGQSREARVADRTVARPSIDREQGQGTAASEASAAAPAPKPAAPEPTVSGVGVQVAAYSDRASAETGWSQLVHRYGILSGFKHRIVEGQADIGTVYRLQAVAANSSAAHELCNQLKRAGAACQVKN